MIALQVCAQGNLSLLRRLLDTSPGVLGARDASGQTLLHVAAREGHLDVCSELVACNAECVTLLDDMGASASDVASSAAVRALLASAQPPSKPSAAARDPGVGDDNEEHDRPACADADTPQLWSLPVDVCEIVLGFVAHGGLSSVLRLSETCRRFRDVASSESLWERMCWQHFKLQRSSLIAGSWREMYVEHRILHGSVKSVSARERSQRLLHRQQHSGLRSSVSHGAVEGTIWGIGDMRVSVEGTIWDTGDRTEGTVWDAGGATSKP